jgi:SAM-dependent methyltransferase
MTTSSAVRINIGCGRFPMPGWVNVDIDPAAAADVFHDLDVFPYPFEAASADEIMASHVLEHTADPFATMREFARVLKPGGTLTVRVPHFSRGFTHADHRRGFDVTFPRYFSPDFSGGYSGTALDCDGVRLHWLAQPYLKRRELSPLSFHLACAAGSWFDFWAGLSPEIASRLWCFWVGGFEEVEFVFHRPTP